METRNEIRNAARAAIKASGGAAIVASRLTEMTGEEVNVEAVRKWMQNGVPPWAVLWVEFLSGIPVEQLRPEMVPPRQSSSG